MCTATVCKCVSLSREAHTVAIYNVSENAMFTLATHYRNDPFQCTNDIDLKPTGKYPAR